MNATKRKFNALLNGLGNKSTTSLSSQSLDLNNGSNSNLSTQVDADAQAKKRRVNQTISVLSGAHYTSRTTRKVPTTGIVHKKSASVAVGASIPTETLKYAPWDRAAFLERLKSFSTLTDWAPKPDKVNEVEWAKRGWVCQKRERVRCCLCNVEILVKVNVQEVDGKEIPQYIPYDIEQAVVDKYAEMIVTSHAENCLWKQRGCDDSIFKLSLNNASATLEAIRERYDGLCAIAAKLPYMHNMHTPEGFDLDTVLGYLPKDFFRSRPTITAASTNEIPVAEIDKVAFTMAVFGWRSRPDHTPNVGAAGCDSCFRTLGLWLFKTKEINEAGEIVRPASMNWLDTVEQHRSYCPWSNAASQNGNSGKKGVQSPDMPGWEIVLRVLKNDHKLRSGTMEAGNSKRPATSAGPPGQNDTVFGADVEDEDAKSIRERKDNERWARLRRVKSLFDTKGVKKLQRNSVNLDAKGKPPT